MTITLESLPDEILSEIFSYFADTTPVPPPYWIAPGAEREDDASTPSAETLYSLGLLSKRISSLSQPFLYRKLFLGEQSTLYEYPHPLHRKPVRITAGESNDRFRHVRELELKLVDCDEETVSLLLSAFGNVTRLELKLQPGMGICLAGIAAGMQNLQQLILTPFAGTAGAEEARIFLSHLLSEDKRRRPAGTHIQRIDMLELYTADLESMSAELVAFARHFDISALSFWTCWFEGFHLRDLSGTKISKLSIDSGHVDVPVDLAGLDRLACLDHIRIGDIHADDPTAIFKAIPPQIHTLQIMFHNHRTLRALFQAFNLDHLSNIRRLEVRNLDKRLNTLFSYRTLSMPVKRARYSAYLSSCSRALSVLESRGARVFPRNLLEVLEGCATENWGEGWKQRVDPALEGDEGQDSDTEDSGDESDWGL